MTKAVCLRDCLWLGRYWCRGEVYEGPDTPPSHFSIEVPAETAPQEKASEQREQNPKPSNPPKAKGSRAPGPGEPQ